MLAKRIDEYNVIVVGYKKDIETYRSALQKQMPDMKMWAMPVYKTPYRILQVSFDGFPELRKELPDGIYSIGGRHNSKAVYNILERY